MLCGQCNDITNPLVVKDSGVNSPAKKKDSGVNYELSECHTLSTLEVNFYEVGSFLHVLFSPLSMHIEVRWTSTEDKENNNSVTLLIAACRVISLNIS